jgi:hypothetical protein
MSKPRKVGSDLVLAAGFQRHPQQRPLSHTAFGGEMGYRPLGLRV